MKPFSQTPPAQAPSRKARDRPRSPTPKLEIVPNLSSPEPLKSVQVLGPEPVTYGLGPEDLRLGVSHGPFAEPTSISPVDLEEEYQYCHWNEGGHI